MLSLMISFNKKVRKRQKTGKKYYNYQWIKQFLIQNKKGTIISIIIKIIKIKTMIIR